MAEPRENEGKVLQNPENWDEMVRKYQEREEEQLKKVMESKNVASVEELRSLAKKSISTRSMRTAREHEPLKSHHILVEPKSQEIKTLRQQLNEEISALFKQTMQELPNLNISPKVLKGRVTLAGAPAEPELQTASVAGDTSQPLSSD